MKVKRIAECPPWSVSRALTLFHAANNYYLVLHIAQIIGRYSKQVYHWHIHV